MSDFIPIWIFDLFWQGWRGKATLGALNTSRTGTHIRTSPILGKFSTIENSPFGIFHKVQTSMILRWHWFTQFLLFWTRHSRNLQMNHYYESLLWVISYGIQWIANTNTGDMADLPTIVGCWQCHVDDEFVVDDAGVENNSICRHVQKNCHQKFFVFNFRQQKYSRCKTLSLFWPNVAKHHKLNMKSKCAVKNGTSKKAKKSGKLRETGISGPFDSHPAWNVIIPYLDFQTQMKTSQQNKRLAEIVLFNAEFKLKKFRHKMQDNKDM